ncbi:MAG: hypothetical protein NTW49_04400 [Bacteroidia bacterium]|nr:hypothetical protein [Bacteroidia bacterium]
MIEINKVTIDSDFRKFIDFPHDLYQGDPNYVPELFVSQKELMDRKKYPFFLHSEVEFFLAQDHGKIVGRIAAIKNNNYNRFANTNVGFFGFFDCTENYEVAEKLLDTAKSWIREKGMSAMLGPENYSTNETCGLLIDGFDSPPVVMMTYNKTYYPGFFEKYGLQKKMDLFAYWLPIEDMPEKVLRVTKNVEERLKKHGITIRNINMKDFAEEVRKIKIIYNSAWQDNWGFVPMTSEEFDAMAKELKMIVDPSYTLIAEHNGEVVGFSLTIPDINKILIKIKRGRLLPTGLLKLLYYKNKVNSVRVITLGILENYRRLGVDACFYAKTIEIGLKKKIIGGEASWILENNVMMNRALQNLNGKVYKKYRIYEIPVS